MHYMIRCNPMHPLYLYSALPVPYVPVRVTRGALVTHQYTFAPPRCRTLQYCWTFIPFSVSLWNHLTDLIFDGVGLAGFKSMYMLFIAVSCSIPLFILLFLHLPFFCLYHLKKKWYKLTHHGESRRSESSYIHTENGLVIVTKIF